jgi:ketosteroid isomerase-like protein
MSNTDSTTVELNREIARAFFTAVGDRDIERIQADWQPGGIDAVPGNRTMTVPDGQRAFFTGFFDAFHDWNVEILDITCEGDVAIVHWRLTAGFTGPGKFDGFAHTGAKGTIQGCDRLIIRDGKIVHLDAYFDTTEMARAIGLMPPAGSGADKMMKVMVNLQTRIKRLFRRR